MNVSIGDACRLYKKCKICGETKYVRKFQTTGGERLIQLNANHFVGIDNHRYKGTVSYDKAKQLVKEGTAGIVHSTLIHHFLIEKH